MEHAWAPSFRRSDGDGHGKRKSRDDEEIENGDARDAEAQQIRRQELDRVLQRRRTGLSPPRPRSSRSSLSLDESRDDESGDGDDQRKVRKDSHVKSKPALAEIKAGDWTPAGALRPPEWPYGDHRWELPGDVRSASSTTEPSEESKSIELKTPRRPTVPRLVPVPPPKTTAITTPSSSSSSSSGRDIEAVPSLWDDVFLEVEVKYRTRYDDQMAACKIHSKEYDEDRHLRETAHTPGEARMAAIEQSLDNMGLIREPHQIQFHRTVLHAAKPHIYGSDYMMYLDGKELRQEILAQMPRRFGKTTMVAMLVAALVAHVPGLKVGIFSTSAATSERLAADIKLYLGRIGVTDSRHGKIWRQDEFHVLPWPKDKGAPQPAEDLISVVYCYAASERSTRGFTVNMTILEEAAHIDENIFKYVVAPAVGVNNMVLLAITTPQDPTNYFSKLTKLKYKDGKPVFLVQTLGLACAECLERGVGHECTHMQHLLPSWKSKERQERVKAMLEHDKNIYAQEVQGLIVEDGKAVFDVRAIARLVASAPVKLASRPHVVYTFIDPTGGATSSSQAVLSMIKIGETHMVTPPPHPRRVGTRSERSIDQPQIRPGWVSALAETDAADIE